VQVSGQGVPELNCLSLPFGNDLGNPRATDCVPAPNATALAADAAEPHFTGKERDTETGLDYFGARSYASNMGRWMSPDWADKPEAVPYSDLEDPQSLNLYGYVRNNPLSHADADGHCCDWSDVRDFALGAANAYGSDNLFGAGRMEQTSPSGRIGAAVGDAAATVTGTLEMLGGGGEALVTSPAAATGVGIVVPAAGAAVALHGTGTTATAFGNLFKNAKDGGSKNDQKTNPDRVQSAKDKVSDLKQQRDTLKSQSNKTPGDKAKLDKLNKAINRENDRMQKSENHSRKEKGQQQ